MRIIAGELKGRNIPFNAKKYGGAESTPQIVKEAVFSIIGEYLNGAYFLDLYSCSGQMGLEAISRGCETVIFNEKEHRRFAFIRDLIREWGLSEHARAYNLSAPACLKVLASQGLVFDYVYVDPPYDKVRGKTAMYNGILAMICGSTIISSESRIIVQHFGANELPDAIDDCSTVDRRDYGTSALTIYRKCS